MHNYKLGSLRSINIILWRIAPGGLEKVIKYYFKYLERQFAFNVFPLGPTGSDHYFSGYKIDMHHGLAIKPINYLRFFIYALQRKNEVFHLFNAGPVPLFLLRLSRCNRIIYHIHGTVYWKTKFTKPIIKVLWNLALYKNIKIISNSYHSKDIFNSLISKDSKVEVIYNPIETPVTQPRNPKMPVNIFFVGRLAHGKNLFRWLEIAKKINISFPDTRFHIFGTGPLKEQLTEYSNSLGIYQITHFHGHVEVISDVYKSNDLMIFISEYESFGNVIVECLLSGTPVIAGSIPSIREILDKNEEFLVELDDNLEPSILDKIRNYKSIANGISKVQTHLTEKFDTLKHFERINKIYNEL